MKAFIINGVESRNKHVINYFRKVGVYEYFDTEIINTYNSDDLLVHWLQGNIASHVSLRTIAGFLNFVDCMFKGLECSESHFVIIQDDVVFVKDWKEMLNQVTPEFFTCLALGVNFHLLPDGKKVFSGNIGGCECIMVSKNFAKFFLENIDFRQATDIVISGMLLFHGYKLEITPICQQTSFLEKRGSTLEHDVTKYDTDWITFVTNYRPTGLSYFEIKKEFEIFVTKKKIVEEDFKERFDIEIDIHNTRYIYERFKALNDTNK